MLNYDVHTPVGRNTSVFLSSSGRRWWTRCWAWTWGQNLPLTRPQSESRKEKRLCNSKIARQKYLSSFLDFSSELEPRELPKSTVNATGLNLSSSCKYGVIYISVCTAQCTLKSPHTQLQMEMFQPYRKLKSDIVQWKGARNLHTSHNFTWQFPSSTSSPL